MAKKILKEDILDGSSAGFTTQRYVPPKDDVGNMTFPQFTDFPYIEDPTAFTTHRSLENTFLEAWLSEQVPKDPNADPESAPAPTEDAGAEPGAAPENALGDADQFGPGGDPAMGGMDQGMGLMPGQPPPLTTPTEIGRVYELKKIYSRLTAIEAFLSRSVDQTMLSLRKYVAQAIDLFEVVITNLPQYKDKLDEIIITFYKFLDYIYGSMRKYFSEE
jgi:hypothetical protein